jgi:hypothetical protein
MNKNIPNLTKDDIKRLKMVERFDTRFATSDSKKLYEGLRKRYSNDGTLSVICYSLKKYFLLSKKNEKSNFWGEKGAELANDVNKQEAKNELTGNEINNWKTQEQILNIMNNIKLITNTDKNRFLLLAMTTLQPPLRKAFYQSVKFLDDLKKNNGKDNYLFLQPPSAGKSYYIVNNDKVSKYDAFNKNESKFIEIENEMFIKLLMKSYLSNPREYVFEMDDKQPYSMDSISRVLLERPFKLNFNILRSSYITNYFNLPDNQYLAARQKLAQKMRHSPDQAEKSYFKRNNGQSIGKQ